MLDNLSIYISWPFPPGWRVAGNTKETIKTYYAGQPNMKNKCCMVSAFLPLNDDVNKFI